MDHAEAQRSFQRIAALFGHGLDAIGFLQRPSRLRDDLLADRRHQHLALAALEDQHAELVFEILHRRRQAGLADEATFGRATEMPLGRDGDDVLELGEGHGGAFAVAGWADRPRLSPRS